MLVAKKFRQLHRFRQISMILARNGFGYLAGELGLAGKLPFARHREPGEVAKMTTGKRIALMLQELGPTYVKLGQIASTRPDLVPADIIVELELLQDHVAPFDEGQAIGIIEQELMAPIDELFARFDPIPLAAASIGQVHRAMLYDGTEVVIKVQRPRIRSVIETDLDMIRQFARLVEARLEWAQSYRLAEVLEEVGKALLAELDYSAEARNADQIAAQVYNKEKLIIPAVYNEYSTRKVLTMAYVDGIKLSERERLDEAGHNRRQLADRFARIILNQVLIEGLFHGDPHPGNVLVQPDGRLALLDFGMVGRLTPELKKQLAAFVIALRNQSSSGIIRAVSKMGIIPEDADRGALRADVDQLRDKYYKVPLSKISMGETVHDLFGLAFRHRITIPPELALLGKTLLEMEGVVTALDPDFSVFDVAEPFGRRLFKESLDPGAAIRKWLEGIPEYVDLFYEAPHTLKRLTAVIRKGKIGVELTTPDLDQVMRKLDRISNRMSFAIMLLSLSIVMGGLIIGSSMRHQYTLLWKIPILEMGFLVATVLFLWLIFAIFRSGRF